MIRINLLFIFGLIIPVYMYGNNDKKLQDILRMVADRQIEYFDYMTTGSPGYLHDYGIDAWTNATLYLGMSRWASVTDDPKYNDWLIGIGNTCQWEVPANFRNTRYSLYHADELCIIQFYLASFDRHGQDKMLIPSKERLDWIILNPPDSTMVYHNKQSWTWCDALFMAPPAFAGMYRLTRDEKYLDFMISQVKKTYDHLYNPDESLFYRDNSYLSKKETNGKDIFWGRGNGWVVAGLTNILKSLPQDSEIRPSYENLLRDVLVRLVGLQDDSGFWHASLLDPDSYPSPETSATALITYALAYAINHRLLPAQEYSPAIRKAWDALVSVVDDTGKLGFVQPIGADPKKVTRDMTAVYGVGAFLMAGTEIMQSDIL